LSASGAGSENYYSLVLPSSSLILPAFPSQRRHTESKCAYEKQNRWQ
jgi:hypothetical protein